LSAELGPRASPDRILVAFTLGHLKKQKGCQVKAEKNGFKRRQTRIGADGSYYASPVAAAGRIYLASLAGKVTVVKAGGDNPEILHQADFG
jgi:hypothetical protein